VSVKNYYDLLEVAPTATAAEIKKAFREQIAKYHPDKVQHLGKEFQTMAAERAAPLTEAYRLLCDDERRAEYDASRAAALPESAGASQTAAPAAPAASAAPPPGSDVTPRTDERETARGERFSHERTTSAVFVRRAIVGRLRQALDAVAGDYEFADVPGFDVACTPKGRLFGRAKGPKLLSRYVDRVDRESIADTWAQAVKAIPGDEVCVILLGSALAPAGELATAINEQRRKTRSGKVTLIPVDATDWNAKMPTDAPPVAKTLIARLRTGA
jgi:hypothetical protein